MKKLLFLVVISLFLFTGVSFADFESLHLENTTLVEFSDWYSHRTGLTVVVADGLNPSVNISSYKFTSGQLPVLFDAVLTANNLQQTRVKDVIFVHLPVTQKPLPLLPDLLPVDKTADYVFKVYSLKNVRFESIEKSLKSVSPDSLLTPLAGSHKFALFADLVEHNKIDLILPAMDVLSPQVLVEAIIMEVATNKYKEVGVSINAILDNARLVASSTFSAPLIPGAMASYNRGDFRSVVTAINGIDSVNLLSSPSILVSSGSSGSVVVGQNVPFVTGSYTESSDTSSNPFQTIERQDVGLSLTVLPYVISDDMVDLVVKQEVSTVSTDDIASDIITDKREIKTRLILKTGDWIYLGGLVNETTDDSSLGVPGLMHIPFIGRAFRIDRTDTVKRDLSVLLRVTFV